MAAFGLGALSSCFLSKQRAYNAIIPVESIKTPGV